jgi:YjbE family integral membrane protein
VEMLSGEFLSALLAIVIIDLVLAGDNAIVIALAARRVPQHLQRRAIAWGTAGAIIVRSALTGIVVWLLNVPGLLLVGGLLLVWIAYRLLVPEKEKTGVASSDVSTFWPAIRTVVVADTVMGLDNVLGVAGAAHGSYLLVVCGLLVSVPIVIWGSTLLLQFVERYPSFVYLGSAVLAWTAVKMMVAEPFLGEFITANRFVVVLLYILVVPSVLWAGFARNHRSLESRIHARLAAFADRGLGAPKAPAADQVEGAMLKVLVPVDDSPNAQRAVRHVANEFHKNVALEVHLLNVQRPLSKHVASFVSKGIRDDFHRQQADKALQPARQTLDNLAVPYVVHTEVGHKARVIAAMASCLHCDHIVMSTARKNSLTRMLEDSTTNKVLELTDVPVELIAGDAVSKVERYGIPAAIGGALALLLFAD